MKFWIAEDKIDLREQNWVEKIINMLKFAQTSKFFRVSRFPENFRKYFSKTGIWNSEFKIDFSDQKWVELIPNMLQFAKNNRFQRISRFPENFWKNFWKTGILKFWAQNPFQWLKLIGNDTQYVGIGPKLQILENFQISRKFMEEFQKYMNFEILTSKSISVIKIEWKW